jgi:hypothetical protein
MVNIHIDNQIIIALAVLMLTTGKIVVRLTGISFK